jgi:FtsP/CotA-like multicopper oxidase with cupredoxin domain
MRLVLLSAVLLATTPLPVNTWQRQQSNEHIAANDNRVAGGRLSAGVLTIRLEARTGQWFPDGDDKPGVTVKAFAIDGGPLQIPGPMIRIPEGTEVRAAVRNALTGESLVVHGLYERPGRTEDAATAVTIPPGETRDVTFNVGKAGTYFYWAATDPKITIGQRAGGDSQLSGAIVVDPPGGTDADRVLVLGEWNTRAAGVPATANDRLRFSINGRSWPNTERLSYEVGSTVRMRLINANGNVHPMHLHGFYFNVDSRGDEREDRVFPIGSSPHLVVTERMSPGSTFSLTWKPTRAGNWLFHCHDNVHLDYGGPLDRGGAFELPHTHGDDHMDTMAGLVMGITVTGASMGPESAGRRRTLRLVAKVDEGGTATEPAFGFALDGAAATPGTPLLPGPTLTLKRGEPVSITVVNQLPEPTSVHWHGIELDSYFDGVSGYGGDGRRVTPMIPPGGSFEARFTPPRSGTFVYHTHLNDTRQMQAGLSGPLLVIDDPATLDAQHDLTFMVTVPRKRAEGGVVLINGSSSPSVRELAVGQRYRLRFINVHTARPSMRMRLLKGDKPLTWRSLAKDGMDLPADQSVEGPSEIQMGNGETYDFAFVPHEPGDLTLNVVSGNYTPLASLPLRIR